LFCMNHKKDVINALELIYPDAIISS